MSRRRKFSVIPATAFLAVLFFSPGAIAQFPPAPGTGSGLAETIEAIDAARVTTRILYITAHPDDESAATLTYLARGLHADVALLSLTHGEGGQNALGPEQAPQLGLIRTQELLAATRGYGVKLYFTRAKDFGFSKTSEETEKIWGDQVLENMVLIIRTFRPNIIINHFGGVHSGHGHHQASGLLTPRAVKLAEDATAFKEQLTSGLAPWRVSSVLELDRGESPQGLKLPIDDVSPLYGKTYREIGLDAFINHRTQGIAGFTNSPFLRRPVSLKSTENSPFNVGNLAQPLSEVAKSSSLQNAENNLQLAEQAVQKMEWEKAVVLLSTAAAQVLETSKMRDQLNREQEAALAQANIKVNRALELAAGIQLSASSDRGWLVPVESFLISLSSRCRPEVKCEFKDRRMVAPAGWQVQNQNGTDTTGSMKVTPGAATPPHNKIEALQPEPTPLVVVEQDVVLYNYKFTVREPVTYLAVSTARADRVLPRVVPAYTLSVEPKQIIELLARPGKPFDVLLRVHSYATQPGKISVALDVPQGWSTTAPIPLEFTGVGDQYARMLVTPPAKLQPGSYTVTALAKRGNEKFSTSLEPLPSLPTQMWEEPAQTVVHAFDINVPENLRVGYITAESEPVPEALRNLAIKVDLLDASALNFSDLSRFDAIVVGVRAYELRSDLAAANQRLLDYVRNGGTMLVQYQRDFAWDKAQYAPYPAKIDSGKPGAPLPRITDEAAPVKFLKPDDPLLNTPNKITQNDFSGWVQERGLYFWTDFDSKYTPLLAMHDPGEPDLNGGLVSARLGKGIYIYTGLAFFRQLPEGVPGAYRLFINLITPHRGQ